jgi:carboxypeptidase Q
MRTFSSFLRQAVSLVLAFTLLCPAAIAQKKKTEKPKAASPAAPMPQRDPNAIDFDALTRIRWEAFHRSKVMETLAELTDHLGPRLTNSPNEKRASAWAREQLINWGMENVHAEAWGPFGPGWSYEVAHIRMVAPDTAELIGLPKAWSRGTDGVMRGKVVRTVINNKEDFAKYKGKLAGAIVLNGIERKLNLADQPKSERYNEGKLHEFSEFPIPAARDEFRAAYARRLQFLRDLAQFMQDEKVGLLLEASRAPFDGGTFGVQGNGSAYKKGEPLGPPVVVLDIEHFNRMARLADRGVPVEVEVELKTTFHENNGDLFGYNSIAEIPGSDLKDEVVMLGAHFDSWHGATGATDNAAGSAIMMEVMRILKATGLKPRRTIRLGLWTGEEEGLLGSYGYVNEHFATRSTSDDSMYKDMSPYSRPLGKPLELKPEHAKISTYFNVDGGTGKLVGVNMQENQAMEPILRQWIEPLKDLGITTLSMRPSGGSDHLSFESVGIPAIDFEQDPIEYESRTHHSNMDTLDRIQREDVMQAAAVVASMVYHAAMRDQRLPRKPLPQPEPALPTAKPAEQR